MPLQVSHPHCMPGMVQASWIRKAEDSCLQVGWACGPAPMIAALAKAHSFLTFTVPANNQLAVAHGLDHEKDFYECDPLALACLASLTAGVGPVEAVQLS